MDIQKSNQTDTQQDLWEHSAPTTIMNTNVLSKHKPASSNPQVNDFLRRTWPAIIISSSRTFSKHPRLGCIVAPKLEEPVYFLKRDGNEKPPKRRKTRTEKGWVRTHSLKEEKDSRLRSEGKTKRMYDHFCPWRLSHFQQRKWYHTGTCGRRMAALVPPPVAQAVSAVSPVLVVISVMLPAVTVRPPCWGGRERERGRWWVLWEQLKINSSNSNSVQWSVGAEVKFFRNGLLPVKAVLTPDSSSG